MEIISNDNRQVTVQEDFRGASIKGTRRRMTDTARPGNALERQKYLAEPHRLEWLAVNGEVPVIPASKMFFNRSPDLTRSDVVKLMKRTLNGMLDRYGSGYQMIVPKLDLSFPPYSRAHLEVTRVVLNTLFQRCKLGTGGSANQYFDVFFSNGNRAQNIPDFASNVKTEWDKHQALYRDCEAGPRSTSFQMPWNEKPPYIWKEDRESQFLFSWITNWKKIPEQNELSPAQIKEGRYQDGKLHSAIRREMQVEHYATHSPMPDTYKQSRNLNHRNFVSESEVYFNERFKELNEQGWDITNFDISIRPVPVTVPGDPDSNPKNQIFGFLTIEKDERRPNHLYPLKQIRFVADTRSLPEILPNLETQNFLAEPLNRLAEDPSEPYKDWKVGVVTFGQFPTAKTPNPVARVIHSVLLTEPEKGFNPETADESILENVRWSSQIVRGPHGQDDPSRVPADLMDKLKDAQKSEIRDNIEQAQRDILRYQWNRDVHDLEWMVEGALIDAMAKVTGEFKAAVAYRNYIDGANFPAAVQGFFCPFYIWQDISRLPKGQYEDGLI